MKTKTAFVGDLHLGVRSSNHHFLDFQHQWLEYLVDSLIERGIRRVCFAGDLFDVRKSLHGRVYEFLVDRFIPLLTRYRDHFASLGLSVEVLAITGNHDITLRESNRISWVEMLQRLSAGLVWSYREPEAFESTVDGARIAMVPWINEENREKSMQFLANSGCKVAVGHLELAGFPMYTGVSSDHGMDAGVFDQFDLVITGHYHTRSDRRNIRYIGSPYHLTWSDYVDGPNRGFVVLDHDTMELEEVNNPDWMTMFSVVTYDPKADYTKPEVLEAYRGTIMKVMVEEQGTPAHMKKFMAALNNLELIDFSVINKTIMQEGVKQESAAPVVDEASLTMKTGEVLHSYIDRQELVRDPARLKSIAASVLKRAEERV